MQEATLGIDIGTSAIKYVLWNGQRIVDQGRINHSQVLNENYELDPNILFLDVKNLIKKSIASNPGYKIKSIGFATFFPSLVLADKEGIPLCPLMTWLDRRPEQIVQNFKMEYADTLPFQQETGCVVHPSYNIWKILWYKKNQGSIFNKARHLWTLPQFLLFQFTGKHGLSSSLASTTGLFNIHSLKWSAQALEMTGLQEEQLSEIKDLFHSEPIRPEITSELNLSSDVRMTIGTGDGLSSNIGSGSLTKNKICSTIGTGAALRTTADILDNRWNWKHHLYQDHFISGISINAGFDTLDWFQKNFKTGSSRIFSLIQHLNMNNFSEILFLPFLNGERGPYYRSNLKAQFLDLTSSASNDEILKSILEGILFNLYNCFQIIDPSRLAQELIATGGYVHSDPLLQMQADIFNIKIKVPTITEVSAFGAALIASVAIGKNRDVFDFRSTYEKNFEPNKERNQKYLSKFEKYKHALNNMA